jgi:hypothetical protein
MSKEPNRDPKLLASQQYLTLDLLEALCAHSREVAGAAFERGESLSDNGLFRQALFEMLYTTDQLTDLKGILSGALDAASEIHKQFTGAKSSKDHKDPIPLRRISRLKRRQARI